MAIYVAPPRIETIPYRVDYRSSKRQILPRLRTIAREVRGCRRIDAVLLACESSTLASVFERPVRPELARPAVRLARVGGPVRRLASELQRRPRARGAGGERRARVRRRRNGGAGRSTRTPSRSGCVTVGVQSRMRREMISRNAFVTTLGQPPYQVRLVHDDAGRVGYDVNEDGVPNVPIQRVSSASRPGRLRRSPRTHDPEEVVVRCGDSPKRDVLDLVADGHRTARSARGRLRTGLQVSSAARIRSPTTLLRGG